MTPFEVFVAIALACANARPGISDLGKSQCTTYALKCVGHINGANTDIVTKCVTEGLK